VLYIGGTCETRSADAARYRRGSNSPCSTHCALQACVSRSALGSVARARLSAHWRLRPTPLVATRGWFPAGSRAPWSDAEPCAAESVS